MAKHIADKLRIKSHTTLLTLHAPADFKKSLQGLPAGVKITDSGNDYDQVHWFVLNKTQLEKEISRVMRLLKPGMSVWVYYPKLSSKMQTDLTRDKGWDCLMAESDKLSWINLISFNETWSVFGFRNKTEADKKKEAKPRTEREIFKWVDPKTKTVKLPDDMSAVLKKKKKGAAFFETLSFTNKKEYIEWIITAKKEETRAGRIKEMIERLDKKWKNPTNL